MMNIGFILPVFITDPMITAAKSKDASALKPNTNPFVPVYSRFHLKRNQL